MLTMSTIQVLTKQAKSEGGGAAGAGPAPLLQCVPLVISSVNKMLSDMKASGYDFVVGKDYSDNAAALLYAKGGAQPLYLDMVPAAVRWAELGDGGNCGSTLPSGAEIGEDQAKFILSLAFEPGILSAEAYSLEEEDLDGLESAQAEQRAYLQTMCDEFWSWAFDNAEKVPNLRKAKTEAIETAVMAIEMAKGSTPPTTDPDVQTFARRKFVGAARAPFTAKDDKTTFKTARRAFKRDPSNKGAFVPCLPPRVLQDGQQLNVVDTKTNLVRSKDLVSARVRFKTWSAPFGYGISCDLIKVEHLMEGGPRASAGGKRPATSAIGNAFAAKRARVAA